MAIPSTRMRIGLDNVVYSVMDDTTDISGGSISYGTVYPLIGAKTLTFDRGASIANVYGDDGSFAVGETVGDMKVTLEVADILPADYARLMGFTYANGVIAEGVTDESPYIAVGFRTLRMGTTPAGAKVYEYFWLPKIKLQKPKDSEKTKDKSLAPRTASMDGQALRTISSNDYIVRARSDDTNVAATTITNWFVQPMYSASVDLTALTVVASTGTGATKTFLLTFSKASASGTIPFSIPASSLVTLVNQLVCAKNAAGALLTVTAAILSAGTGFSNSPVTVTVTSAASTASDVICVGIAAGSNVVDNNGVAVTAYANGGVTLHA